MRRGRKRKIESEKLKPFLRHIIIYPIDKITNEPTSPPEPEILPEDIAAHSHIDTSHFFKEVQRIAKLCEKINLYHTAQFMNKKFCILYSTAHTVQLFCQLHLDPVSFNFT